MPNCTRYASGKVDPGFRRDDKTEGKWEKSEDGHLSAFGGRSRFYRHGGAAIPVALNVCAWVEDHVTPAHITANNACVYVGLFKRDV